MQPIIRWLSKEDLVGLYSATYWNDIEEEKKKEWWIEDGNYDRCKNYLKQSGYLQQYQQAEKYIVNYHSYGKRNDMVVADIAAGIGWVSALASRLESVNKVLSVEMSEHRLERLFEHAVRMFDGEPSKISRYLGSFYDLKFEDKSVDVILLSQAFHHADQPIKLLNECDRILKDGGRIILIGEQYISGRRMIRRMVGNLVKTGRFTANFYELFKPDLESGDHYYRLSDYYFLLGAMGYGVKHEINDRINLMVIADKSMNTGHG